MLLTSSNKFQIKIDMWILLGVTVLLLGAMIVTVLRLMEQSEEHVDSVKGMRVKYSKAQFQPEPNESDQQVKHDLEENPNISDANYQHMEMTKSAMRQIGKMGNLGKLNLSDCVVKDPWFRYLSKAPLETLLLNGSNLGDDGVEQISKIKSLKRLEIIDTEISGKCLSHLAPMENLAALCVNGTKVTDDDIKPLQEIPKLAELSLSGTLITDEACDTIAHFDHVASLDISHTAITLAGLAKLKQMKSLTDIRYKGNDANDDVIKLLVTFPRLYRLDINGNKITDKGLAMLSPLPLQTLNVSNNSNGLTDEAVRKFQTQHPTCSVSAAKLSDQSL